MVMVSCSLVRSAMTVIRIIWIVVLRFVSVRVVVMVTCRVMSSAMMVTSWTLMFVLLFV